MYVCLCRGIKESQIREFGKTHPVTAAELIETFGLDDEGACQHCLLEIDHLLDLAKEGGENDKALQGNR